MQGLLVLFSSSGEAERASVTSRAGELALWSVHSCVSCVCSCVFRFYLPSCCAATCAGAAWRVQCKSIDIDSLDSASAYVCF